VLVDEGETARGLPAHQCRYRRHVLALAPAGAGHALAGQRHGGARGIGIAEEEREEGAAGLGHRQPLVGGEGGVEGLAGPTAIGEQQVHSALMMLGGGGRRGGEGEAVAIDGHTRASILSFH
jgi:hypothetical protein